MSTRSVAAKRWEHGWELHIPDVGVTQATTLAEGEQVARDYLCTFFDLDECTDTIVITPELGGLEEEARHAMAHTAQAARAQRDAAREARAVAHKLRAAGLSVTDTAVIMGVSRGRISQLTKT